MHISSKKWTIEKRKHQCKPQSASCILSKFGDLWPTNDWDLLAVSDPLSRTDFTTISKLHAKATERHSAILNREYVRNEIRCRETEVGPIIWTFKWFRVHFPKIRWTYWLANSWDPVAVCDPASVIFAFFNSQRVHTDIAKRISAKLFHMFRSESDFKISVKIWRFSPL